MDNKKGKVLTPSARPLSFNRRFLSLSKKNLRIREDKRNGVHYPEGLKAEVANNPK